VLLDAARTPSQRREIEPRWQLAVFLAALCHDAGKPVTDLIGIYAYFLDWREGRSRQHTALANLSADRIVGADGLEWIEEGGHGTHRLAAGVAQWQSWPTNLVYELVVKADQSSVERDLRTLGVAMAEYDLGVPVERHLTDVMRRLVKEGTWLVNQPGARGSHGVLVLKP
jgi:conjugal transfer pilus assembly protein TraI